MIFDPPLQQGILLRRYKRFLADVELPNGDVITMHCPNTGSMKNCQPSGARLWYSTSDNSKRKYANTWEVIEVPEEVSEEVAEEVAVEMAIEVNPNTKHHLVGIHTGRANSLIAEALLSGQVSQLSGFTSLRREVPYGSRRSRIDILLEFPQKLPEELTQLQDDFQQQGEPQSSLCYVEVKTVSLGLAEGCGEFPDAVTVRGQKHLQELMEICAQGHRAVLIFCVQHSGIRWLQPADSIDPEYGRLLRQAIEGGVEVIALSSCFTLNPKGDIEALEIAGEIPLRT